MMPFILSLALILQGAVVTGPTKVAGPSIFTQGSAATPVVSTSAIHSCSTINCTVNFTAPAGTFGVIVHIFDDLSTATLTAVRDCAGSSQCSATTDTLVASNACANLNGNIQCEYYFCQSTLAAGASSASVFWSTFTATTEIEIEVITGMLTASCNDVDGTNSGATGSPTATTSSNVAHSGELTIAYTIAGVVPSAGSGYTTVQVNGGFGTENSNSAPASGAAATASFTTASTSWGETVSTWRSQ